MKRDALLLDPKVFLALEHHGRQASSTSVVSAKVEASGVVMQKWTWTLKVASLCVLRNRAGSRKRNLLGI